MLPYLIIATVVLLLFALWCGFYWFVESLVGAIGEGLGYGKSKEVLWFTLGLLALIGGVGSGILALILAI